MPSAAAARVAGKDQAAALASRQRKRAEGLRDIVIEPFFDQCAVAAGLLKGPIRQE
jgi:hypothetical protein